MEYKDKKSDDILEKLVHINRITKVVKGGRRFGFSALVVVGNQAGKIGIAHAKAKQVPDAIKLVEKAIVPNTIKKGGKLMKPINLQSAQKLFSRPLVKSYLRDMAEDNMLVETMTDMLYDRVPDYQKALIDGDSTAFFEKAYDIKDIEK